MIFTLNQKQRAELAGRIYFLSCVARKAQQPCLLRTVSWIKDTYAFLNWYVGRRLCLSYNLLRAVWMYSKARWASSLCQRQTEEEREG